jgi:hypothetical protein
VNQDVIGQKQFLFCETLHQEQQGCYRICAPLAKLPMPDITSINPLRKFLCSGQKDLSIRLGGFSTLFTDLLPAALVDELFPQEKR